MAVLGPSIAIYGTDILLRRNRYDGEHLHDETPGSRYWYRNGVNWAGATALLLGTAAALLCVDTPVLVGPVATALDGADLSSLLGPAVAAAVYALGMSAMRRTERTAAIAPSRPAPW